MPVELEEDSPTIAGIYVAYVNGSLPMVANRVLLFWDGSKWLYPLSDQKYRDHVYGWVGPLPVMRLED